MQDLDWSKERSAKVIYTSTSDESDIHMRPRFRIRKTSKNTKRIYFLLSVASLCRFLLRVL